ncbi:hypothetical protein [Nitratiruptor sp. YY09-18]|uniref:hypothetical protein n=1 Tax=Nitratiruptor sp. YY09-18 TaxID=2724901 RepID=UPI001916123D|nr:hypothetical protein [Nitratiruptor sp. YY09-18]BCD68854.1 hypothetical protein NitYY0918_C1773 [Nitratiruptor sp. YY09-18]
MYSKKILWAIFFTFLFVSLALFYQNLPAPKNKRVYEQILPYFPYTIQKELGGIDIVDKRTGKDLNIDNVKVYVAFDELLRKWGKKHLLLSGDILVILDDNGHPVKKIQLNQKEREWVKKFFGL